MITRVLYRERQPIAAADLADEQAYLLGLRHRHDLRQHTWGIVSGLALTPGLDGVTVGAGFAVDAEGRGLRLARPGLIRRTDLDAAGGDVGVLLSHRSEQIGDRLVDRVGVELATGDLRGAVFLGRVTSGVAGIEVKSGRRPYAGLTGSSVMTPNRRAQIRFGPDGAGDRRRFAVTTDGTDRITVDRDGVVGLTGDTTLHGKLTAGPPGVRFGVGAVPEGSSPWRVHRAAQGDRDHLRIEIGNPGRDGDPALHALTIGAEEPALTTTAKGTTTIRGKLTVEGVIVDGPVRPDLDDPRLADLLLRTWSAASATAGLAVDERYRSAIAVDITPITSPVPVDDASYTITVRNTGTTPVSAILVAGRTAVGGGFDTPVLATDFTELDPAETDTEVRVVRSATGGTETVRVSVVAAATGPAGSIAFAMATRAWPVEFRPKP